MSAHLDSDWATFDDDEVFIPARPRPRSRGELRRLRRAVARGELLLDQADAAAIVETTRPHTTGGRHEAIETGVLTVLAGGWILYELARSVVHGVQTGSLVRAVALALAVASFEVWHVRSLRGRGHRARVAYERHLAYLRDLGVEVYLEPEPPPSDRPVREVVAVTVLAAFVLAVTFALPLRIGDGWEIARAVAVGLAGVAASTTILVIAVHHWRRRRGWIRRAEAAGMALVGIAVGLLFVLILLADATGGLE